MKRRARDVAYWASSTSLILDHVELDATDLSWLSPASTLTFNAVRVADGVLRQMPNLDWLSLSGGSGQHMHILEGCTGLEYLCVNQIRGVNDLSVLGSLTGLRLLSLYGLPQVTVLPSLAGLTALLRVELGSMKRLSGMQGVLEAPSLEDLFFINSVGTLSEPDLLGIEHHPTLELFGWYAPDVPERVWVPVVARIEKSKSKSTSYYPDEWMAEHPPRG